MSGTGGRSKDTSDPSTYARSGGQVSCLLEADDTGIQTHAFRLAQYEQLWNLKFPNGPSGATPTGETHPVEDLLRFSASSQDVNIGGAPMDSRDTRVEIGRLPDTDPNPVPVFNPINQQDSWSAQDWVAPDGSYGLGAEVPAPPSANEATMYPPTRPASPQDLSLREVYEPHTSSHTPEQEWRELDAAENNTSSWNPGMLDGMGATQLTFEGKKAGAGYIGLSSSATLLLAIRRLVAKRSATSITDDWIGTITLETWADQPSTTSSEDIVPTPFPRFPPARETLPLVDSYFTYFRKPYFPSFPVVPMGLTIRHPHSCCARANGPGTIVWRCPFEADNRVPSSVLHDLCDGRRRFG
jgi:hypothetical protein